MQELVLRPLYILCIVWMIKFSETDDVGNRKILANSKVTGPQPEQAAAEGLTLYFTVSIQSQLLLLALLVKCMQRCTPLYRCEDSCASTMNSNHVRHACCMRSYMVVIQLFIRQLSYSNPIISTDQWGSCPWTNQSWKWMCSFVPRCSLWGILLKSRCSLSWQRRLRIGGS